MCLMKTIIPREDCILITRTMLIKTKRLVRLCKEQAKLNNLDASNCWI